MKKLWLTLLSLGLVMAFSASALAVDIKTGAEFYVGGLYLNKIMIADGDSNGDYVNPSTAFLYQRLRVGTDFIVSPCLKLVTRFDAMERIWGGVRSNVWQANEIWPAMSAETRTENENIAVDIVYIDYTSPVGRLKVGYMPDNVFGTVFGDYGNAFYTGQINYSVPVGPFTIFANYAKEMDNSSSVVSQNSWYWRNRLNATKTDRDWDSYRLGGIYNFKGGEAGIQFLYSRYATHRGNATGPWMTSVYALDPYVKTKIGPVALQAELNYFFGDWKRYEGYVTGETDVGIDALSVFVDADANFGMFNVGGTFAYVSGDDPATDDKREGEGELNSGGTDWNPCLILFNFDTIQYWVGGIYGHDGTPVGGPMTNAWFLQGRVGVSPTPQLDVLATLSWAQVDKKPSGFANGTYGTEIDLIGTYKITNNLSYMLGVGYLFAGDLYKGAPRRDAENRIVDDFILINKLTLTF